MVVAARNIALINFVGSSDGQSSKVSRVFSGGSSPRDRRWGVKPRERRERRCGDGPIIKTLLGSETTLLRVALHRESSIINTIYLCASHLYKRKILFRDLRDAPPFLAFGVSLGSNLSAIVSPSWSSQRQYKLPRKPGIRSSRLSCRWLQLTQKQRIDIIPEPPRLWTFPTSVFPPAILRYTPRR